MASGHPAAKVVLLAWKATFEHEFKALKLPP
jgi:hypothetical protein